METPRGDPQCWTFTPLYSGAKVIGYPADKMVNGQGEIWGMSGDYNLEKNDTLITYNKIDTSGGQSGSPIFCHDEVKSNDDNDIFMGFDKIVGVHTG